MVFPAPLGPSKPTISPCSTSTETSKKGLWLESVQRESFELNLDLVVLNGCNTGATANRNYFKGFSTNERTGLSSAFLLNRHCTVIGTQWNEPEIVGLIRKIRAIKVICTAFGVANILSQYNYIFV